MPTTPATTTPKDRFAFDRWDRLGYASLMVLVGVVVAATQVLTPLRRWISGEPIPVPYTSAVRVPELDAVHTAYGDGRYEILLTDPGVGQRLVDLAPGVLVTGITLAVLWLLLRFMREVGAGDPFAPGQVRRLRVLAGLLAFGMPVAAWLRTSTLGELVSRVDLGTLPWRVELSTAWLPILVGLGVALVAEAFKTGARLRDDVDGLI